MKTTTAIIIALLLVAGCQKIETPQTTQAPDSTSASVAKTARVAAVMAANDITVADIASYLYPRGWTIDMIDVPDPSWTAPTTGGPVWYYICEFHVVTANLHIAHRFRDIADVPPLLRVRAVGPGGVGPWSEWSYADNGDGSNELPGVRP